MHTGHWVVNNAMVEKWTRTFSGMSLMTDTGRPSHQI